MKDLLKKIMIFLRGAGTILDIGATDHQPPTTFNRRDPNKDYDAICADWSRIVNSKRGNHE